MAQIYLGRVRGTGMYTTAQESTSEKNITIQKALVSPTAFPPVVGDAIIFANGDVREVISTDDLFVFCGEAKANFKGEKGDQPTHYWQGSVLTVTSGSGTSSADLKGDRGIGISKIEQTTTSNQDGGTNVVTITLSDGQETSFSVKNGNKGAMPDFSINEYGELVATIDGEV